MSVAPTRQPAPVTIKHPTAFCKVEIGELESLDPVSPYDTRSWELMANVYETLLSYNLTRGVFLPRLAREIPSRANGLVSEDGLVYRFPIRTGVSFHQGQVLTAEDVAYSLQRLIVHDAAHGPAWMLMEPLLGISRFRDDRGQPLSGFDQVARAIRTDGDTLVLRLSYPFAPLLAILATPPTSIVCKSWAVTNGEWPGTADTVQILAGRKPADSYLHRHMDGTGPYRFVSWEPERKVELARHDAYWGPRPPLERVTILKENDWPRRRQLILEGDVDMVQIDRTFVPEVKGQPGIRIFDDLPLPVCDTVSFNFAVNPDQNLAIGSGRLDGNGIPPDFFSDGHVRRALQWAFDWDRLINEVYLGKAIQLRGPIPGGIFGHNPEQPVYHLDLTRSESEFRQAWDGKAWEVGFRFTLYYNAGNVLRHSWARLLQERVTGLNPRFRIDLQPVDLAEYRSLLSQRRLPIFTAGWLVDYPDPHDFVQPMLHSRGIYPQWQSYANAEVDHLVEAGARELDPDRRRGIYHRLQEIAFQEAKDIYTVEPLGLALMRDWVQGWEYDLIHGPQAITLFYHLSKG